MRHGDAGGPDLLPPKWTTERKKPKGKEAKAGGMGTIAQCLPGDIVACESLDRRRVIFLEIAWCWPDGKATQVRLWDFKERRISLCSRLLRTVQNVQRVRWLAVRPK